MRVCIELATGKLLEMQSNGTEGTLTINAVRDGYALGDIEEKEVTSSEWLEIQELWIDAPGRAIRAERQVLSDAAHQKLRDLGLTDAEIGAL